MKNPKAPSELYPAGTAWQLGLTESWVSQSALGALWIGEPMRKTWVTELLAALPRRNHCFLETWVLDLNVARGPWA